MIFYYHVIYVIFFEIIFHIIITTLKDKQLLFSIDMLELM